MSPKRRVSLTSCRGSANTMFVLWPFSRSRRRSAALARWASGAWFLTASRTQSGNSCSAWPARSPWLWIMRSISRIPRPTKHNSPASATASRFFSTSTTCSSPAARSANSSAALSAASSALFITTSPASRFSIPLPVCSKFTRSIFPAARNSSNKKLPCLATLPRRGAPFPRACLFSSAALNSSVTPVKSCAFSAARASKRSAAFRSLRTAALLVHSILPAGAMGLSLRRMSSCFGR